MVSGLGHIATNTHLQFVAPSGLTPEEAACAFAASFPTGNTDWQLLRWDNTLGQWVLLNPPALGAAQDYKDLQRKTDDTLGYDYDRAHG